MDTATLHRRTVETWTDRVAAVAADQWDEPTPCTEWSVRDLVNHVTGEERWTVPLMQGRTIADVGDTLDGDLLGAEAQAAARQAARDAMAVVDDRLPSGGKVNLSYGEEEMDEYVRQLCADHLVHAWDLAAATGGGTTLDPDLVQEIATWFADREDLYRSGGAVGPRLQGDGDPQSRLLAAFGRSSTWTPPRR
jgi:uncharacterized protein (TIGR03086 family)